MSASQCLEHPWLKKFRPTERKGDHYTIKEVLVRMAAFKSPSPLKR